MSMETREQLRQRLLRETEEMEERGREQMRAFMRAVNWEGVSHSVAFIVRCMRVAAKLRAAALDPAKSQERASNEDEAA